MLLLERLAAQPITNCLTICKVESARGVVGVQGLVHRIRHFYNVFLAVYEPRIEVCSRAVALTLFNNVMQNIAGCDWPPCLLKGTESLVTTSGVLLCALKSRWPAAGSVDTELRCFDGTGGVQCREGSSAARQKRSKLAVMSSSASVFTRSVGIAVDVIFVFMALLSFCGISTPSLPAQGEQRRSSLFNIPRDIARKTRRAFLARRVL